MQVEKVHYDDATFGITQRSLKMLRDTLASRYYHNLCVYEIPTDNICCGFLVLDLECQDATFVGDGFRSDKGGEGGRGYKVAMMLLDVFGLGTPLLYERIVELLYGDCDEVERVLFRLARVLGEETTGEMFKLPAQRDPWY